MHCMTRISQKECRGILEFIKEKDALRQYGSMSQQRLSYMMMFSEFFPYIQKIGAFYGFVQSFQLAACNELIDSFMCII